MGSGAIARAYDFTIDLRTIGQGYQVRRFAADGSNELLSRRRLTQYLDLNVYDIELAHSAGERRGLLIAVVDAVRAADFAAALNRSGRHASVHELG